MHVEKLANSSRVKRKFKFVGSVLISLLLTAESKRQKLQSADHFRRYSKVAGPSHPAECEILFSLMSCQHKLVNCL